MQAVSHQTVRLTKGRHTSPAHGVCVMELASMLAGEAFSDHPSSVSRSISAFMRTYNDLLDDERRQDLYSYAAKIIGTRGCENVEVARVDRLISWGDERWAQRSRRSVLDRIRRRLARAEPLTDPRSAAGYALHALGKLTNERHAAALALVDELMSIGNPHADAALDATKLELSFRALTDRGDSEIGEARTYYAVPASLL
jgi:hypothetical protein